MVFGVVIDLRSESAGKLFLLAAVAVGLEFTQQRQRKEHKSFESKSTLSVDLFDQSTLIGLHCVLRVFHSQISLAELKHYYYYYYYYYHTYLHPPDITAPVNWA